MNQYIYIGNNQLKGPLKRYKPNQDHYNFAADAGKFAPVEHARYHQDVRMFEEHLSSLPVIEVVGRHHFKENEVYREGEDFRKYTVRTWCQRDNWGYGCAECCNRDRCDEDCDATYYRPNCPYCKGKGWLKSDTVATPITKEVGKVEKATYEKMKADYERMELLEAQIGELKEGQHLDERLPRAETWLKERENWQTETDALRQRIKELEEQSFSKEDMLELIKYCAKMDIMDDGEGTILSEEAKTVEEILEDYLKDREKGM